MVLRAIPKKIIAAIAVLACLGLCGTIYRMFFVWFAHVPTGAMMNTILIGDRVIFTRSFFEIERGSVVTLQYPNDSLWYTARVIGLPGESIEIRGQSVVINGTELPEQKVFARERDSSGFDQLEEVSTEGSGPYKVFYTRPGGAEALPEDGTPFASSAPLRLGEAEFFLMGDNRDNSEDSRFRGPVPRSMIWGTASAVYYSAVVDNGEEHVRSDRFFKKIK
jgi:signal peptidase I